MKLNPSYDPYLAVYERFVKESQYLKAYSELNHKCYWEAGEYSLKMIVQTTDPNQFFEESWRFTLTAQDVDLLRLNPLKILDDACARPPQNLYYFAYPKCESKTNG